MLIHNIPNIQIQIYSSIFLLFFLLIKNMLLLQFFLNLIIPFVYNNIALPTSLIFLTNLLPTFQLYKQVINKYILIHLLI